MNEKPFLICKLLLVPHDNQNNNIAFQLMMS